MLASQIWARVTAARVTAANCFTVNVLFKFQTERNKHCQQICAASFPRPLQALSPGGSPILMANILGGTRWVSHRYP